MTITLPPQDRAERVNSQVLIWICRVAGFVLFGLGLEYWVRLVGFYEGALWRFDLMPVWWKVAAAALAVLYPVAGVGLWMTVSWGAVLWAIVALVEVTMHLVFPALFGGPTIWLALHIFGLSMLVIIKLVGWWEHRQRLASRG